MKKENELLNQTILRLQKELDDSNKLDVSYYRINDGFNNIEIILIWQFIGL